MTLSPTMLMAMCVLCRAELPVETRSELSAMNDIVMAGWRVVHLEPRTHGVRSNPLICAECAKRFNVEGIT